ncbi:MAG: penicillin-binding protein [Thermodesulfobacteriota bacterium]
MKRRSINWFKFRIILMTCLIFVCFVLIAGRMFQLQVLKKEELYRLASQQHRIQIPIVPKRGTIYDSKENELAVSIEVDSVFADPRKIIELDQTVQAIASVLQIDRQELMKRFKKGRSFEWVQRKISPKEAEEIKSLQLSGIYFLKENRRFYPNGPLAAHVIGFVGLDSKGLEGVEYQYDSFLQGEGEVMTLVRDARGREIALGDFHSRGGSHIRNVILTLDRPLQHIVEMELCKAVEKWGAKGGMAIAMDPFTGKVLAMASHPSFDPNQFIQYRSKNWRNRAIADTFEPGSLFKTFLAAAAIEEKAVKPSDPFYCENGEYTVYDHTIHDHSKHGWLTFQQIIKFSSNIGASKVGEKMGKERFYQYLKAFGFGEKTRIGLPGEEKGVLHHPRYWVPVTLNTISFGQGVSVTGIQLITALSAIANGGILMKPYVVEKITDEKGGLTQSFQPEAIRRVISEETARTLSNLLKSATEKGGTGEMAVPNGYEVAGKTGTAQKPNTLLGGYYEDRYLSGFMGFGPLDRPKIVLLVVIDEPQGNSYGGVVAAPVFRAIMEKALPYLNIFPKGTMVVRDEGDSSIPKEENFISSSIERVRLERGTQVLTMPDLTGLSMRNALSRIEGKGLIIRISGNGRVVDQSPKPGSIIEKGDICYLKFSSS